MTPNPRKEKCFNNYSKLEVGKEVPAKKGTVLILLRLKECLVSHSMVTLVCPGCQNRTPKQPGRIPNRILFSTGLEAVNSKIKMAAR